MYCTMILLWNNSILMCLCEWNCWMCSPNIEELCDLKSSFRPVKKKQQKNYLDFKFCSSGGGGEGDGEGAEQCCWHWSVRNRQFQGWKIQTCYLAIQLAYYRLLLKFSMKTLTDQSRFLWISVNIPLLFTVTIPCHPWGLWSLLYHWHCVLHFSEILLHCQPIASQQRWSQNHWSHPSPHPV